MEVHHHPKVEKKNFKEYFLEFLMMFLAVTMGFFAESYREHIVERNREKEYMKEVVANLKYDTLRCSVNAITNVQVESGFDSLREELKKAIHGNVNTNALYYFELKYGINFGQAVFNTSAITELKNSGSLRLIENKQLVSDMADYYERKIYATETFLPTGKATALQSMLNEFFSLIDLDDYVQSFDEMSRETYSNVYDYKNILEHEPPLRLLNSNPPDLERLYTQISLFEAAIKNYNFWLHLDKAAAEKLITDIQKEYNLEN